MNGSSRGTRRMLVALVVIGLLAAACSSSGSGKAKSGDTGSTASLGAVNKATGTPVKIGLMSDGKSDAIDNTPELKAMQAGVDYVNNYLGGLNGHVIEPVTCETKQTPAGATACATKLVDAKVAAVLAGVSGQAGTVFNGLSGSGIPFVMYGGLNQDIMTKPGAYMLTNGLAASVAGPAAVARDKKLDHAAVVVINVPDATGPISALAPSLYKNANAKVDIVTVAPGTADMTPDIQAELGKKPKLFSIIGDAPFCTSALKAIKTLGFSGPIVLIPTCIDTGSGDAIPGGYEGMIELTTGNTDPASADYKLYSAVMDKYASGVSKGGVATGGYLIVRNFVKALTGLTGEVTPASVTNALNTMKPVPMVMGGGIEMQCGAKKVAITPNVCSTEALTANLDKSGNASGYKTLETGDITKLGG